MALEVSFFVVFTKTVERLNFITLGSFSNVTYVPWYINTIMHCPFPFTGPYDRSTVITGMVRIISSNTHSSNVEGEVLKVTSI